MPAIVDYVEDIEVHTSADGMEVIREKGISADSFADIINQKLLPGYGTRHPDFPQMRLISGQVSKSGNDGGKWQGWWRGTYSSKTSASTPSEKDPWELDAHEYSAEPFAIEQPMIYGYDKKGKRHQLKNSAGCMLQRQNTIYGVRHSFLFCVKDKGSRPRFNQNALVNSSTVKIAGETFEAYTALLTPPSASLRVEYNDSGSVKRSYWEVQVEIRQHPRSWETETLNVGTMAKFPDSDIPEAIYKYTPWTSKEPDKNFNVKPVYGSIRDVARAKHTYAKEVSGGTQNDQYWQAYKELPWEEVTEPLPFDLSGRIYTDAMTDPDNNEYYVVALFDTEVGSFSQYGFPRKREGD